MMKKSRARQTARVNGEDIVVSGVPHLRCPRCDETVLRYNEWGRLEKTAFAIYRTKHGLLSDEEIREIRESLGLTQAELASLLRLGGNTISRWESGRNVQSAAMDVLLRLIRDMPESLKYLRSHAA